ncbi:DUF4436 domain-containing protein [Mycobacterium sp. E1747]|nr:DUF4436 domain-containing protein [Mycobacterium sp. E1747]
MKMVVGGVVAFIAAYVVTVALYTSTGLGRPSQVTEGQPAADGTLVTIDLLEVQPINGVLTGNLIVSPGPELLDPQTHVLKQDLGVAVASVLTSTKRNWPKGEVPGIVPVSMSVTGDPAEYPFDHYRARPIAVEILHGATQLPEQTSVTFVDRLRGWKVTASKSAAPPSYRVNVQRSPSTGALAVLILGVLVLLAGVGLFVAVQTARGKRKFQPPMTTWYAAMLFAVIPLRNALPDAPPMGWWVDVTVVVWVIVILALDAALHLLLVAAPKSRGEQADITDRRIQSATPIWSDIHDEQAHPSCP